MSAEDARECYSVEVVLVLATFDDQLADAARCYRGSKRSETQLTSRAIVHSAAPHGRHRKIGRSQRREHRTPTPTALGLEVDASLPRLDESAQCGPGGSQPADFDHCRGHEVSVASAGLVDERVVHPLIVYPATDSFGCSAWVAAYQAARFVQDVRHVIPGL